jgi:hypothetical protein
MKHTALTASTLLSTHSFLLLLAPALLALVLLARLGVLLQALLVLPLPLPLVLLPQTGSKSGRQQAVGKAICRTTIPCCCCC